MDLDCYRKEDTPYGTIVNPRTIDFKPVTDGNGRILTFKTLSDSNDLRLQATSLLLIWQKGNDPVFPNKGLSLAECLMEEIFPAQLTEEANRLLLECNTMTNISYSTTEINGTEYLTFNIEVQ